MMSEYLGLDAVGVQLMIKLFDRKEKISADDFAQQAAEIFGNDQVEEGLIRLRKLVSATTVDELPVEIHETESVKELENLFDQLKSAGVTNAKFDITLMRGLDYYTGMVFEVFDLHPENNRAMFGGGRYDGLVGLFGADPLPTVGFAPGLTTTELFLRSHNLLPQLRPTTEIAIVVVDDSIAGALDAARKLRQEGVSVEVDISGRKLDKQMKSALKKEIPHLMFIGANEVHEGVYTLKDTATASEQKLSLERIVTQVKDRRQHDDLLDI